VTDAPCLEALAALLGARARRYVSDEPAEDPRELLAFAAEHRQELGQALAAEHALAGELSNELVRGVERRQQFAAADTSLASELERVFARSLRELALALADDQDDLAEQLPRIFESEAREVGALLRAKLAAGATVCAEYSLELQLDLLGISLPALLEPILDLGCGERAALVRQCQALGKVAFGLDRHADGPNVIRADWLEHSFPQHGYGTILSHQAFSLHFLHHHLGSAVQAASYARKYMELLGALKPGGSFVYTPGLPFVEQHLPATKWRLTRAPLPSPLREAVDSMFSERVGAAVAYACKVTRRSP
jgi:hypothetical protein